MGRYAEAGILLKKAIYLDPENPDQALYQLEEIERLFPEFHDAARQ